jgi:hypothetical protein
MKTDAAHKWGVEPGMRVWVGGHNVDVRRYIERHLSGTIRPPIGPVHKAFIAPQSVDEAVHFTRKLLTRLVPNGSIWVVIARDASEPSETCQVDSSKDSDAGVFPSDAITPGELHEAMQALGLAPGEPCGLGDTYSAVLYHR